MQPEQKILVADIGNSRLKLLAAGQDFSFSGQDYTALDFDENLTAKLSAFLKGYPACKVYFSSVNRENISQVKSILNNIGSYEPINIENELDAQQLIDFSGIDGMGNDRKLGLLGALKHSMPPFITVDCGTAVTVNACDEEAKCLGGVIFAGIRTQLKALTQNTDALKNINPVYKGTALGKNTESAMGAGIILSIAEGIQGHYKRNSVRSIRLYTGSCVFNRWRRYSGQ